MAFWKTNTGNTSVARYSRINRAVVLYDSVKVNLMGSSTLHDFSLYPSKLHLRFLFFWFFYWVFHLHTYPHLINLSKHHMRVKASIRSYVIQKIITLLLMHFTLLNDLVMQMCIAVLSVRVFIDSKHIINCDSRG